MAKLIQFERRDRPISKHVDVGGGPKVLMFTGVRYQRNENDPQKKLAGKSKRKGKVS